MAEVTITIRTEDADEAVRAAEAVTRALEKMGMEAKVVAAELKKEEKALGTSTKEAGKATEQTKTLSAASVEVAGAVAGHVASHKALALVLQSVEKGVAKTAAGVRTGLTLAIAAATQKLKELAAQARTLAVGALPILAAAVGVVATVIGVKLGTALAGSLRRIGLAGAAIAVLSKGFNNLSIAVGSTGDRMLRILRAGTLNAVSNFELLRLGSFALSTELIQTEAQMAELARLGTALGIAVGEDAAFGIEKLTRGIVLHNIATLKQLGLVVSTRQAYEDYAKELDKTVGDLNEVERRTAFANAAFAKANELVDRQAIELDNLGTSALKTSTALINLGDAMREAVSESEQLTEFETRLAEKTTRLGAAAEGLAFLMRALTDATFGTAGGMLTLSENFPIVGDMVRITESIGAMRLELDKLREAAELVGPPAALRPPERGLELPALEGADLDMVDRFAGVLERLTTESLPGLANVRERIKEAGQAVNDALVPAMRAMGEQITISREEIDSLAQLMIGEFQEDAVIASAEALRDMQIEGVNLIAVLDAIRDKMGEVSDVTREQAAAMTAAASALRAGITDAFTQMGESIGKTLAGLEGGMESFGSAIVKILGTLLQTLGRILIAFGVAGLAIQAFALNPVGAIVAGVALVALGAALAGAATSAVASGLAGGGGGFSGGLPTPPRFQDGGRVEVIIQIVARDLDREGGLRILEEINASGQLDRPIQLDTALVRID